jgi:hypothetical protein
MTMFKSDLVSRRTVLRGLGTAVALPFLDSLLSRRFASAATASSFPKRLAFMYLPNGVHMPTWLPTGEGTEFALSPSLASMAPFRDDMLVVTGLKGAAARAGGHSPGSSAYLTGTICTKSMGADIRNGTSVDQIAAVKLGHLTRLPSMEISVERFRGVGNCESGYSCVYQHTITWRGPTAPLPNESDPRLLFNRLFSSAPDDPTQAARLRERGSVLDTVLEQASGLNDRLSGNDRHKLDQYLTSVREVEQRMSRADKLPPVELPDDVTPPRNIPADLTEHIRLLMDIVALAFQTDTTRIVTYMFGREGSELQYRMIGVSGSHHLISHHKRRQENFDKLTLINTYHSEQLAYLFGKLKAMPEGEGTVLDNCLIACGGALSDGNSHSHRNIPMFVMGRGGGTLRTGRLVKFEDTPVTNLWVGLLNRFGVPVESIGDSTGELPDLS